MGLGLTLTARRKDGTEFPIEVSLTHIPDEESGLTMAFVTDISARVEQDRQARQIEKLASLGSLAAGIAHELNNPIGIILSRIELMLLEADDQPVAGDSRADLQVLHRHAQRLSQITQGLLSFGRERQRAPLPLDLNEVVEETLLLAGKQLGHVGIHVLTTLDTGLPRILGDTTALEQVLINLVLNARDAMPTGGTLRIETSLAPAQSDAIRLVVSDTGSGMLPEVLAKLGQSFFTTKPQGSGLGLSVSFTIIREHGGTVDVRSEPGHGTVFTIVFPPLPDRSPSGTEPGDPAA
jgi:signal transduction histidine kinase